MNKIVFSGGGPQQGAYSPNRQTTDLMPKDFIKKVLIDDIGTMVNDKKPWISFAMMAIGIEFLGKCMDITAAHWNVSKSKEDFQRSIKSLNSFSKYKPYLTSHKLWDSLRNGFAHSFVIKGKKVSLSSNLTPNEFPNLHIHNGQVNLKCEDFYNDFKSGCFEVIAMPFNDPQNKMNMPLILIHHV